MGFFFLEFGLRYQKNLCNWKKYNKNVVTRYINNKDLCRGFKNIAKIRYFQRDPQKLQKIYFMKKVAPKGLHWLYIGESWRKVAEIG